MRGWVFLLLFCQSPGVCENLGVSQGERGIPKRSEDMPRKPLDLLNPP
nr:MAG TPA: hypothetical protein [Inoviridae sp.]